MTEVTVAKKALETLLSARAYYAEFQSARNKHGGASELLEHLLLVQELR
jgi:hypothetical protein